MIFNYVRYEQDGHLTNIGIEVSLLTVEKNVGTSFIQKGKMAFLGAEGRHRAYEDLLVLAEAIRQAGHKFGGYEELVKDVEKARRLFREYEREKDL